MQMYNTQQISTNDQLTEMMVFSIYYMCIYYQKEGNNNETKHKNNTTLCML